MAPNGRAKRRRARRLVVVAAFAAGMSVAAVMASRPRAAAVTPGAIEPARVRVASALVDEIIKGLLPLTLSLPMPSGSGADGGVAPAVLAASLIDLRYCGAGDHGAGRFRAAVRLAGVPAANGANAGALFGDDDCKAALGDIGKRLASLGDKADGSSMVLADLEATWRPWELRLTVARFVQAGDPRGATGWAEARREVLAFSTAGLSIPTDLGSIVAHAAPSFGVDAIDIVAVLGEAGSAPPASRPTGSSGANAVPLSGEPGANATAELPYALANQVLSTFTSARALPVRLGRETVDVQNVSLRGAGSGVAVAAFATSRTVPQTARVTVTAAGDDLRVASLRAEAQLENCGGLGFVAQVACSARNAARNAAAAALGAAATDRYQGQLVRELSGPQQLRLSIGRRDLRLIGDLVRIAVTPRGLLVSARLEPREPVP